ncbi:regulatory GntR family protein [Curtobacterium sp. PhB142]|uniref:GntR family transcriptional regulator n=1 Tax=unclassified Curtobacterium TaxID=257496 RepID=UPI000FA919B6|nr:MULTISPECIES: GntR family transcriptional regulator [unclassified Curtobacterium]ROS33341.1 regulatory GntR family protein [Curtobacterium sp. PhB78]RPE76721.1 regulatory GntR family protein [Curtobacterium sp. PhB137]TCL87365.1 regulatory GntR family protein [Curtobacterium sp. PhB142]TCM05286.1 regulatory GntR family protein [Curtobacterium sp. PhB134]TCU50710.1 regulatory GntR family protein [Curtobacterium sp. PhB146]
MITLSADDPTPPFEQVRKQLADAIRSGELTAHERLPSIRQLAGDLRVAPGTVARAYQQLEADGLIATGRGRGTTVRETQAVSDAVVASVAQMVESVRGDVGLDALLATVASMWEGRRR